MALESLRFTTEDAPLRGASCFFSLYKFSPVLLAGVAETPPTPDWGFLFHREYILRTAAQLTQEVHLQVPSDLRYTENDEWIRVDGDQAEVGVTDYAQDQLSDVVYVEISVEKGDEVKKGAAFGTIESVKAASDVYLPVSGKVTAVNDILEDTPELINDDPYGEAWLLKIEIVNAAELEDLMDHSAYQEYRSE